jgi:hypothetical protein
MIDKKQQKMDFFFILTYRVFLEKGVISYSKESGEANFWAELDLNQRRHIANEFTVRPH